MNYLETLDETLAAGAARFTRAFAESHCRFILSRQHEDGGFVGRHGASSLYYTDFAVRALTLLSPNDPALARVANWLAKKNDPPVDVIDAFQRLNIARLLRKAGCVVALNEEQMAETVFAQALPDDGFARKGGQTVSAYDTFIAGLCLQMLEIDWAGASKATERLRTLRRADGGFSESPDAPSSQTNATAAAISFLTMFDAIREHDRREALCFFAAMQSEDGGFRAHARAKRGDLLSTFTTLVVVDSLDGWDFVRAADVARFLKSVADPNGGFRASIDDVAADAEYTFYGVGATALLHAYATARLGAPASRLQK